MTQNLLGLLVLPALIGSFVLPGGAGWAQGTAFTYQGVLTGGGTPANGSYDLVFSLFATTNVPGQLLAWPVTNLAVGVTNGLFTTTVDFGTAFTGGSNWLEIAVSTNGANTFFTLAPRQPVTPVPYALFASRVAGLNIQATTSSPNVILGDSRNTVAPSGGGGALSGGTVGGGGGPGAPNSVIADYGVVSGGQGNLAGGYAATVPGGLENLAYGSYSFAAGQRAQAWNDGSFVWADDSANAPFATTANNQFLIRAAGGVGIGTTAPQTPLDVYATTYGGAAAQFDVNNCGAECAQTDYQEAIRLWNQNPNGQVGLGFLVDTGSFNSNAVPGVWIGTSYVHGSDDNDFKIATRATTSATTLTDRVYVNGTSGNVGIGTTGPSSTLQVNGTVAAGALRAPGAGVNTGTYAFIQVVNSANVLANETKISNPVCDNDPNAILIVTHNWSADTSVSHYNTTPVGVFYATGNWWILNEDQSSMALGRAFNVLVIKP